MYLAAWLPLTAVRRGGCALAEAPRQPPPPLPSPSNGGPLANPPVAVEMRHRAGGQQTASAIASLPLHGCGGIDLPSSSMAIPPPCACFNGGTAATHDYSQVPIVHWILLILHPTYSTYLRLNKAPSSSTSPAPQPPWAWPQATRRAGAIRKRQKVRKKPPNHDALPLSINEPTSLAGKCPDPKPVLRPHHRAMAMPYNLCNMADAPPNPLPSTTFSGLARLYLYPTARGQVWVRRH